MRAKKWALVALVMAAGVLGSACSTAAAVDRIGLYYGGGPIEGNHFEKVVRPGSGAVFQGPGDSIVWLPINQRNYIVSRNAEEGDRKGDDFIRVPAKGGVDMDFEVSVYFKLNTRTDDIKGFEGGTLRRFYEQICKKYGCASDDGWDTMLNDNFRKLIEASMRQKAFNYTVDELYANAEGEASGKSDAIEKIQTEIAAQIKDNVNTVLGGPYFCGPTFDRSKPDCPPFQFVINSARPADQGVIGSYADQRKSANGVVTAQNDGKAKEARAAGDAAAARATQQSITPEYVNYLQALAMRECAANPQCTLVITPPGTNVNVNSRR